jgi:hypothetical protein
MSMVLPVGGLSLSGGTLTDGLGFSYCASLAMSAFTTLDSPPAPDDEEPVVPPPELTLLHAAIISNDATSAAMIASLRFLIPKLLLTLIYRLETWG